MKKIVIIGAGFGGLTLANALKRSNFRITLLDKTNHHLFQPLLYQVASAALSSSNIAIPIRELYRKNENVSVFMANIVAIDKDKKEVQAANGEIFPFDYLVVATGAAHSYFGHPEWEEFAPGLKTIEDALKIRERILLTFEEAERCKKLSQEKEYLRFVIIGAGPTGVEMAGSIAEICKKTLFRNFRRIAPEHSEIILIEGLHQVLPAYPKNLGERAKKDLENLGVKVLLNTKVTKVVKNGIYIADQFIASHNIIWAAGNIASSLLKTLDTPLDRSGRAIVEKDLSLPGHPNIFVIGDACQSKNEKGEILPGIAPVAIQQGKYVAKLLKKQIPENKRKPFVYWDKGMLATIGRAKAVGKIKFLNVTGYIAWLLWGLVHIFYLISFKNRFIVMFQWFFLYITGRRQVRIIRKPIQDDQAFEDQLKK